MTATGLAVFVQSIVWINAEPGIGRLFMRTGIAILAYSLLTPMLVPLAAECSREIIRRARIYLAPALSPAP